MTLESIFSSIFVSNLTIDEFLVCMIASLLMGLLIAFFYTFQTKYTKGFIVTLVIVPAIVAMIIMMVNDSIGAGIAVAGAFSLIRFRSVPGTAKEIGAVFLAVATGLGIGMGQVAFSIVFTILVGGVNLILCLFNFGTPKEDKRILAISMPHECDYELALTELLTENTTYFDLNSIENCKSGAILKLEYEINLKDDVNLKTFTDELKMKNQNNSISITKNNGKFNQL